MHYLISYDLVPPGQDYERINNRLYELGARRVLWSTWTYSSYKSATGVWLDLLPYVDFNDRLLVVGIDGWQSTLNLLSYPLQAA